MLNDELREPRTNRRRLSTMQASACLPVEASSTSVHNSRPPIDLTPSLDALHVTVATSASCEMPSWPSVEKPTSPSCIICIDLPEGAGTACKCNDLVPNGAASPTPRSILRRSEQHGKRRPARQALHPVGFATCHTINVVPRLAYTDIVGDVRDQNNPNFYAIGVSRMARLAQLAESLTEQVASECFARWREKVAQRAGERARVPVLPFAMSFDGRDDSCVVGWPVMV